MPSAASARRRSTASSAARPRRVSTRRNRQEIRVTAELPSLDEKDVEITVEEGVLTLRGEKRSEVENRDRGYSERSYGRFERCIGLPRGVRRIPVNGKAA